MPKPEHKRMGHYLALTLLLAAANPSIAAENPLSIKILDIDKVSPDATYLLFSVDNKSNQRFDMTMWSCVFFNGKEPVYEEMNIVNNVPPNDRAISREIQGYGGPFDDIQCRFMESLPSTCPCP